MILQSRLSFAIALASGLAMGFAFPPFGFPLFAWISVAMLMAASRGAGLAPAALGGLLHGAAFYALTIPWFYTVMRDEGHVPIAAAAAVLALVIAVLSIFPAVFAAGFFFLARRNSLAALVAAPFLWVALEFGRTHMPAVGFPWNLLGYAGAESLALLQIVSWTGIYGLSFLVAAANAYVLWLLNYGRGKHPVIHGILLLVLFAALLAGDSLVPSDTPKYNASLVQTNFAQMTSYPADWLEAHARDLDELERLSVAAAAARPGLVVWPEVPAPFSLQDSRFAERAARIARDGRTSLLVGVVEWKPPTPATPSATASPRLAPFNSAVLLDPAGGRTFQYDKIHLVPFGEYVPQRNWLTFAGKLTAEVGDFASGDRFAVGALPAGPDGVGAGKFAVFICYEAIFPDLVRRFSLAGADLFINLSNDGWFGRSAAPEQHLAHARVRAVENRRWMLRATNNGHTVVVDPYGRIVARMETDRRGVLAAPYDFRSDVTPYARFGDWLAWLCVAVSVFTLAFAVRRGP